MESLLQDLKRKGDDAAFSATAASEALASAGSVLRRLANTALTTAAAASSQQAPINSPSNQTASAQLTTTVTTVAALAATLARVAEVVEMAGTSVASRLTVSDSQRQQLLANNTALVTALEMAVRNQRLSSQSQVTTAITEAHKRVLPAPVAPSSLASKSPALFLSTSVALTGDTTAPAAKPLWMPTSRSQSGLRPSFLEVVAASWYLAAADCQALCLWLACAIMIGLITAYQFSAARILA